MSATVLAGAGSAQRGSRGRPSRAGAADWRGAAQRPGAAARAAQRSLGADDRPSRISHPQSRAKMRQSRRKDTDDHDAVRRAGPSLQLTEHADFRHPHRSSRYEYLRDVQREVFDEWYERRSEGDLVIKMNTGNGKTLVGTADQHQRRSGAQHPRGALPGVHRGLTDHADVPVRPAARVRREDHLPVVRRGRAASA